MAETLVRDAQVQRLLSSDPHEIVASPAHPGKVKTADCLCEGQVHPGLLHSQDVAEASEPAVVEPSHGGSCSDDDGGSVIPPRRPDLREDRLPDTLRILHETAPDGPTPGPQPSSSSSSQMHRSRTRASDHHQHGEWFAWAGPATPSEEQVAAAAPSRSVAAHAGCADDGW